MKTEYHLVLTSNKHTFKDWMYKFMETFGNIPPTNHYNHTKQQLKVFIENDVYYYLYFTPQMDVEGLRGFELHSIIDHEDLLIDLPEESQFILKSLVRRLG